MDPGWDHTENEDKLLLSHTLLMNRDMGTVMELEMSINSVAEIGCNVVKMSTVNGLTSLSSEYSNQLLSVVSIILNTLNNNYNEIYDIVNFVSNFILLLSNSLCCINRIIDLIPCIKNLLSTKIYFCNPNFTRFKTCLNEINTKINCLKTYFSSIYSRLICIKCYLINIRSIDIYNIDNPCNKSLTSSVKYYYDLIKSKVASIHLCVDKSKIKIKELTDLKVYLGKMIKNLDRLSCSYSICCSCNNLCIHVSISQSFKNVKSQIENVLSQIEIIIKNYRTIQYNTIILKYSNEFEMVILQFSNNLLYKFFKCSLQSVSKQLIEINTANKNRLIKDIGDEEVDNPVMNMYSVMSVMDYWVVVNRLYDSGKKIDQILQHNINIYKCKCILGLEGRKTIDLGTLNVQKITEEMTKENKSSINDSLKLDKISEISRLGISENHVCLCMVIKYVLYPRIINMSYWILGTDLETLSTISRKFQKYNNLKRSMADVAQFFIIMINLLDSISNWIIKNYYMVWISRYPGIDVKCFCCYYQDRNYYRVVSIILVLSSLMENIWTMDSESLRMSIERLSTLYSQLESYDLSSVNDTKKLSCNSIYTLLLNKQCQEKVTCECKPGEKCCCSTIVNAIMICISLCLQCKLCNALCNNKEKPNGCDKFKKFCEVKDCKCECKCPKNKGWCCLLKLALCTQVPTGGGCEDLFKKCCEECAKDQGCCKKILEKVKAGLCKLLLLGCGCNDGKCGCTSVTEGDFKTWCLLFGNECNSVAIVVFCKCGKAAKGCCCLNTLVDKFKSAFEKVCSEDCCCKDLQTVCDQICGSDCAGCVCKKLQESLKTICNGKGQNCNGPGKCLCQKIEEIKSCIEKCTEGTCQCCKNKGGCCRCVCYKIVAQGVRLLTRACRSKVLEPYKKIVLELLNSSKNKREILQSILNRINGSIVNNIYLVKNNLISSNSYPYSIGSYKATIDRVTNVETRNWGYDTKYEHDVTNDRGFRRGDQYPYVTNRDNSYSNRNVSSSRVFKMVLSRLLVGGVIVFMFIYLRVSYSINNTFCILYIVK